MADQHLAAERMAIVDLPADLRVLVDFLHQDSRPTAVFRNLYDGLQELVYGNPAFERCRQEDPDVDAPIAVAGQDSRERRLPHELKSKAPRGDEWEVRVSGDYHIVVATANGAENARPTRQRSLLHNHHHHHHHHNNRANGKRHAREEIVSLGGPVARTSLDWTSAPVPNMSPWLQFMRAYDWASTGIGPMESWPPVLRQLMLSVMANPSPRTIIWGDNMTFVYNEACVQLFGSKHPEFMGVNASVAWASVWDEAGPLIDGAYAGRATSAKDMCLTLDRCGFLEETFWNITSLPILSPDGPAAGALSELFETTLLVTGERRRSALEQMNRANVKASTLQELWPAVMQGLESTGVDFPFALLYAVVDDVPDDDAMTEDSYSVHYSKKCVLMSTIGVPHDNPEAVDTFPLTEQSENGQGLIGTMYKVWKTRATLKISAEDGSLPPMLAAAVPGRSFGDPIRGAVVSAIKAAGGQDVLAILVAGMNPRCSLNGEYNLFIQLVLDFVEKAAVLVSLPQEQRRAQKIADEINNALAQQLRLTTLQAERSEARFSRLADTAPTGMYMFDGEGRMLYGNDSYLNLFGMTREEAAMKRFTTEDWKSLVHDDDLETFLATWTVITEQKVPVTIEYRLNRPYVSVDKSTGREVTGETWFVANAFPEIEADGSIATVQGWLTDISHRKFSENMMAQRLADALENKRQSENFIDMTSHEMRNPLSAILQSADSIVSTLGPAVSPVTDADMILPRAVAEEVMDAAQTIILCAQHQKRIVDDILTLSKLDASLLVISPDKVHPPTLVTKALKMYEAEITRAGIVAQMLIESSYTDLAVSWVVLDPSRLLQVIINLLTNAIKFTQYSTQRRITICLGASLDPPTGRHHGVSFIPPRNIARNPHGPQPEWGSGEDIYVQIAVIDTGRGLSTDEMKTLFQRFQQASPKTYKQYGGSGLGLFISRELCELQGGQIGVASGDGTTNFSFFVKAKRLLSPDSEGSHSPIVAKPTLPRFSTAPAGTLVLRHQQQQQQQQQQPTQNHHHTHNHSLDSPLPPPPFTLTPYSNGALPATSQDQVHPLLRSRTEPGELHILIVEDNLINQKVLSQQLRKAGCTVHVANHGVECLNFLEQTSFCAQPVPLSIILLDLEMPTMDGLTCIRMIRERQREGRIRGHVPVIAVTANARSEQISVAIEAGMDEVVTKPFRIPELVPRMRALVAELAGVGAVGAVGIGRGGMVNGG